MGKTGEGGAGQLAILVIRVRRMRPGGVGTVRGARCVGAAVLIRDAAVGVVRPVITGKRLPGGVVDYAVGEVRQTRVGVVAVLSRRLFLLPSLLFSPFSEMDH